MIATAKTVMVPFLIALGGTDGIVLQFPAGDDPDHSFWEKTTRWSDPPAILYLNL